VQFPITIGLHRSRFLALALASLVLLAVGMVMAMPWSIGVRLAICLFVSITAVLAGRQLGNLPAAIRLEQSGKILLAPSGTEQFVGASLLPGTTVHPWLTVVRLKTEERQFLLIVAVDTLKQEDFRRLRIFLRWRAEISAAGADVP
jgi:toxin CptA